jgi:probable rRNA maturation factor
MRAVEVLNQDSRLILEEETVQTCLATLDDSGQNRVAAGSLDVAFVNEEECSRLHGTFFDDPEITDVMTFPGEPEDGHAGDIAVCPAVAATASTQSGLPFREELTLYLVHAWLHLSGMDDRTDTGRAEMRLAEDKLMRLLRARKALLVATWKP